MATTPKRDALGVQESETCERAKGSAFFSFDCSWTWSGAFDRGARPSNDLLLAVGSVWKSDLSDRPNRSKAEFPRHPLRSFILERRAVEQCAETTPGDSPPRRGDGGSASPPARDWIGPNTGLGGLWRGYGRVADADDSVVRQRQCPRAEVSIQKALPLRVISPVLRSVQAHPRRCWSI